MSVRVVVLGAGYAGCTAVRALERRLDDAELTWISEADHHLVLHEVHRVIADPSAAASLTIPVGTIKASDTTFVRGRVTGLDVEGRQVELEGGDTLAYDYALVALGSDTAFYGIPGMADHAHTLNSLDDALDINRAVATAGEAASRDEPARVIVGGAGLSGIQVAGELAELRNRRDLPVEVTLVEALEEVLPGADPVLQRRIRGLLEEHDIRVVTDDAITEVGPEEVSFGSGETLPADVLVWTGGITGRAALSDVTVKNDHRRLRTDRTFQTSDDRVYAVGDAAVVGLDGGAAPPTAQAAWDGAEVAAANVARSVAGRDPELWNYHDKGTLISIGRDALAYGVWPAPVSTFGGRPAALLKKMVAARWIASVSSWRRATAAWAIL